MLPILPQWDPSHLDQLVLDLYELNKFGEFNSLFPNIVNSEEPVRAALHGCANQLTGCPCGCRQHPFSEVRLKQKGLFGALIPTGGDQKTYLAWHFAKLASYAPLGNGTDSRSWAQQSLDAPIKNGNRRLRPNGQPCTDMLDHLAAFDART
jgi:hypothetical protein